MKIVLPFAVVIVFIIIIATIVDTILKTDGAIYAAIGIILFLYSTRNQTIL